MPVAARPTVAHIFALAALTGAVACGDKIPTAPSGPSATPVPYSIMIGGTLSLHAPGDSGQLTATATFTGGTTKDVTAEATWTVSGSAVKVSRAGLVTALKYGNGEVVALLGKLSQSITVRVAPEGTFLLEGTVTNASQPLVADVEATSASGTYRTTSDASGKFGVPAVGATTLQVSRSGYDTEIRQVTVNQDEEVTVELKWSARSGQPGPINYGGYTLTFIASASCTLPPEGRQRTYGAYVHDAKIYGEPWDLDVTLDGAAFAADPFFQEAGFIGTIDGNTVRFTVSDDPAGYYTFVERIGTVYMHYRGTASGTVSDRAILTTFNGRVVLSTAVGGGATVAECTAADHRLEFVR